MPGRRGRPSKKIKKTVVQVHDEDGGQDETDDKRGQSKGLGFGFSSLPSEMIALILDQFSLAELKPLRLVNKFWRSTVHPVFDSRAVVVLNPQKVMKLKTKDEVMQLSVSSVKLTYPVREKWRGGQGFWRFEMYRKRVLVLLDKTTAGGGALVEVVVGELDAPLEAQKMFLRQVFSVCPDLKKCVDVNGTTLEVFVAHQDQRQIDQRQDGEVDGFLLLPAETKFKILEHLSLEDLKLVSLVNQAWRSAASTMMGKKATLIVNSPCLDHMLESQEKFWFNSFLIHFVAGSKYGRDSRFLEYQEKVLNLLRTKVVGGGAGVEELTICKFNVNLSMHTKFLQELFTLCPNVKMLCMDRKDDLLLGYCEELPILEHCKTVKLVISKKRTPLGTGIVNATPNVERLILGKNAPDIPTGWPQLSTIEGDRTCPPELGSFTSLLSRPFRAKEFSCLILNNDWHLRPAANFQLLPMMTKYAESLEVLDIKLQNYESFTSDPAARRPVMKKLHTLSLLDTWPSYLRRGGIFGDVRQNGGRGPRMGLDTHFPALHTLRFTIEQTRRTSEVGYLLYFLQYFPPLLEGRQVFPNIVTLELCWPNPEEKFNLWRDWTRRAAIMFPNVKNNEHIDRWKAMQLETPDVVGNGPDEVEQQWQRHLQKPSPTYYYNY